MMNKKDWLEVINAIPDDAGDVWIVFKLDVKSDYLKLDTAKKIFLEDSIEIHQVGDIERSSLKIDTKFNTVEIICQAGT